MSGLSLQAATICRRFAKTSRLSLSRIRMSSLMSGFSYRWLMPGATLFSWRGWTVAEGKKGKQRKAKDSVSWEDDYPLDRTVQQVGLEHSEVRSPNRRELYLGETPTGDAGRCILNG